MRTRTEWIDLFKRLGLSEAEQWADCEVDEDLGNLPRAAFLHQAWKEIPGSQDAAWVERWMATARKQGFAPESVAAFDRLLASGARTQDLVLFVRPLMAELLFRFSYLLDDASLEDPVLADSARWGLYEESADMQPLRRMGCIHELVHEVDPERQRQR